MSKIIVGFEGSCPQSTEGVKSEGPDRFRLFPSWRPSPGISEEAVGRSTRLGFKVVNDTRAPEPVEILVDWQYDDAPPKDRPNFISMDEFMSYRDFVVVKGPGETAWRTVMGDVEGSVAAFRLHVAPGDTEIHWHPPYTYTQCEEFVSSLRGHPLVSVEKAGQSREARNVWLIRITDESPKPKKNAFIRARVHAYESAGSYALEGMVRWLLRRRRLCGGRVAQVRVPLHPHVQPRRRVQRPWTAHLAPRRRPHLGRLGPRPCARPHEADRGPAQAVLLH